MIVLESLNSIWEISGSELQAKMVSEARPAIKIPALLILLTLLGLVHLLQNLLTVLSKARRGTAQPGPVMGVRLVDTFSDEILEINETSPECHGRKSTESICTASNMAKGDPSVWGHQFARDYRCWEPQVRFFSPRYHVINYDTRGCLP